MAYSGPAEEGYSREAEFWAYVGGQVWCYSIDEGRDCDGYWTHTSESVCPVDQLRARDMFGESRQWAGPAGDPDNWGIFAPQWQPVPKSQARDVFAEAMGY